MVPQKQHSTGCNATFYYTTIWLRLCRAKLLAVNFCAGCGDLGERGSCLCGLRFGGLLDALEPVVPAFADALGVRRVEFAEGAVDEL